MQVKVGNYLFVMENIKENIHQLSVCTEDGASIVNMKMSDDTLSMFVVLLNNIALDMDSGFVNFPLASPNFMHTIYISRNNYKSEINIKIYKTDILRSIDKHVVSITTNIESREIEQLHRHLSNLLE